MNPAEAILAIALVFIILLGGFFALFSDWIDS